MSFSRSFYGNNLSQGPTGPTGTGYWSLNQNNSSLFYNGDVNVLGELDITGSISAHAFNSTSDYRIKDNITTLDNTFVVDNLRPVTYLNNITKKTDIGVVAHELQEEYPYLVSGEKDGMQLQSVNYIGIIGILINEIKEIKNVLEKIKNNNKD